MKVSNPQSSFVKPGASYADYRFITQMFFDFLRFCDIHAVSKPHYGNWLTPLPGCDPNYGIRHDEEIIPFVSLHLFLLEICLLDLDLKVDLLIYMSIYAQISYKIFQEYRNVVVTRIRILTRSFVEIRLCLVQGTRHSSSGTWMTTQSLRIQILQLFVRISQRLFKPWASIGNCPSLRIVSNPRERPTGD